jgi:hypothetical protein
VTSITANDPKPLSRETWRFVMWITASKVIGVKNGKCKSVLHIPSAVHSGSFSVLLLIPNKRPSDPLSLCCVRRRDYEIHSVVKAQG